MNARASSTRPPPWRERGEELQPLGVRGAIEDLSVQVRCQRRRILIAGQQGLHELEPAAGVGEDLLCRCQFGGARRTREQVAVHAVNVALIGGGRGWRW